MDGFSQMLPAAPDALEKQSTLDSFIKNVAADNVSYFDQSAVEKRLSADKGRSMVALGQKSGLLASLDRNGFDIFIDFSELQRDHP